MSWLNNILALVAGFAIVMKMYDLAQCMLLWIIIVQLDDKK